MISSQILLGGFVLYWLNGQYQEEQARLHEQLDHEYHLVHDQLVDSMLLKRLIIPSIEDSIRQKIKLPENSPPGDLADSGSTVVMMKQFFARPPDEDDLVSIHVEGISLADTSGNNPTTNAGMIVTSGMVDEDRMVQSIKLFINENEETFRNDSGIHVYAMQIDSTALFQKMEQVLESKAWHFALAWPGEEFNNTEADTPPGVVLSGGPSRHMPVMLVQSYKGFLYRSILPQLFFSLVLLVLSGSALLFAYRSLKKQIALHQLRDDFIANISHELKTPVSTVKIALEALRKYDLQKDPELSRKYLDMSASELERLELLVGRVLQHDMLRNPALVLQKESSDLDAMVQKVLRTLEIPIRENGATIRVMPETEIPLVNVDPVYMEGVILNLVDNALKYAGPEAKIEILLDSDSSGISLSVRDQGPGIPRAYRKQVFDKFFRVPSGLKHNVKGSGLGLNFASQVMKQHKGSITMKPNDPQGCIFTLHFPNPGE